ncbi:MAG: host attachment protein [Bosea sp.]|uniref:host attachment protein n=1 Tax=Bosea sp. (in: a-proteobacteria) TaxID=1871050 RepID=UPI001AC7D31B|nr:host attachment protein [Bosea sp. (in: a-proteobacteria)]MBN9472196.1 host attachment protein [Bosea sp. (in: a-proteobacteria)]
MDLRIPHDAWVIVCDARKAMFLRNQGSVAQPKFEVVEVKKAPENPPSARQGTDRPGRMQNAVGPTSATEGTDWHELAEIQFARDTAAAVKHADRSGGPQDIVLVAPPRILALLRQYLDVQSRSRILAEVDKDLTKHPIHEIERLLTAP